MEYRKVLKKFNPSILHQSEGTISKQSIGAQSVPELSPFLFLDHSHLKKPTGYPEQPRKGIEVITYNLQGQTRHITSKRTRNLKAGDVHYMLAGRGIIHAEIPKSAEAETVQLWINLKSDKKSLDPKIKKLDDAKLVKIEDQPGVKVKVIVGQQSSLVTKTPCLFLDVQLDDRAEFIQDIQPEWNSLVYVLEGSVSIENKVLPQGTSAVLTNGQRQGKFVSAGVSRFLLVAGEPIKEFYFKQGSIVMRNERETKVALRNYTRGIEEFEGALNWESEL